MNVYKELISDDWVRHRNGIEWTQLHGFIGATSNPIRGCPHDCAFLINGEKSECYAKTIAERGVAKKSYPKGFAHVSFHPEELKKWRQLKMPHCIFCDSMSDAMSREVETDWVEMMVATMKECSQHIFQLLTKNPVRLSEFSFPENCWVGVSVPPSAMNGKDLSLKQQATMYEKWLDFLGKSDARVKFTSIEPLSWDCSEIIAEAKDKGILSWAIIGAASNGKEIFQPEEAIFGRLLQALEGIPVFFKGNLDTRLAMRLGGWREEFPVVTKPLAEKEEAK